MSKACWLSFGDWLRGGCVSGMLPATLRLRLGPVWRVLPLARQAAEVLGPWLLALLEARQRAGLAAPDDQDLLDDDLQARPLTLAEAQRETSWAQWRLEAELLRLVEAPMPLLSRSGWAEWEVRYWALVITLARVSQLYAVLAAQPGIDATQRLLASAGVVWQRALAAAPLAA
jgi:hypothetical protein